MSDGPDLGELLIGMWFVLVLRRAFARGDWLKLTKVSFFLLLSLALVFQLFPLPRSPLPVSVDFIAFSLIPEGQFLYIFPSFFLDSYHRGFS